MSNCRWCGKSKHRPDCVNNSEPIRTVVAKKYLDESENKKIELKYEKFDIPVTRRVTN